LNPEPLTLWLIFHNRPTDVAQIGTFCEKKDFTRCRSPPELVAERKVRFLVGWVEPDLKCWVSYLNPTYKKQAFNAIPFQGVKPNKSIRRVFVQALIIENF
jgi:hypothetical protein